MIKMVRLDERLIHGQIAIKWSRHTGVDRIIVADDAAASNSVVQKSLMMAAPATCKTAIKSVDDAIKLMNDPRAEHLKILTIVSNPTDLCKVLANVKDIPLVNIGNYGRIATAKPGEERHTYRANLYAYPEEVEEFKKALSYGVETVYQTTPEDAPEHLDKVLGL